MTIAYTIRVTQIVDNDEDCAKAVEKFGLNEKFMNEWKKSIEELMKSSFKCDGVTCDNIQVFPTDENKIKWNPMR